MIDNLDYVEQRFVFRDDDDKILFGGTPDRVLEFNGGTRAVVDYKMGRIPVQPAESNLQLRAYLTMGPASDDYIPEAHEPFRPSNLLRRKACPGSLALESEIPSPPDDDDGTRYAEEGRMLHAHLADRSLSREHLLPEQFETVQKAEAMEAAFLEIVKKQMEPEWGYGAIIQPRIANKPFIVAYSRQDLWAARKEIIAIWHAAHQNNAARHPGADACRHCRATAICEEHKTWIMAVEKVAHLPAASWTPQQWDMFLTRKSALQNFINERYEEAKLIKAANPEAIPGWELQDGVERRCVTDIVAAWGKLVPLLSAKQFSDCCELSIGELEKAIWKSRQGTPEKLSQKAVKAIINELLAGIVEKKRNKPSLVQTDL